MTKSEIDRKFAGARQKTIVRTGQWNLGRLIDALKKANPSLPVYFDFNDVFPVGLKSWRGSYDELAISYFLDNKRFQAFSVNDILEILESAVGEIFDGYKGGEYTMSRSTPLWVANWGIADLRAVVGIDILSHNVFIKTDEVEFVYDEYLKEK